MRGHGEEEADRGDGGDTDWVEVKDNEQLEPVVSQSGHPEVTSSPGRSSTYRQGIFETVGASLLRESSRAASDPSPDTVTATAVTEATEVARVLEFADPSSSSEIGDDVTAKDGQAPHSEKDDEDPASPPASRTLKERIMAWRHYLPAALAVTCLILSLGVTWHYYKEAVSWKIKHLELEKVLQEQQEQLNTRVRGFRGNNSPPVVESMNSCDVSVLDSCWLKVGLGRCGKEVMRDPSKSAMDAWINLEDAVYSSLEHFAEEVQQDISQISKTMRRAAGSILDNMGIL